VRLIGALSEALEAGVAAGRERRSWAPGMAESYGSLRLRDAFRRGYKRGRRLQAELEQQALELTEGGE